MLVYPAKKKQTNACLQDDVDGDGPGLVSTKGAAKATAGLLEYLEQAFFYEGESNKAFSLAQEYGLKAP